MAKKLVPALLLLTTASLSAAAAGKDPECGGKGGWFSRLFGRDKNETQVAGHDPLRDPAERGKFMYEREWREAPLGALDRNDEKYARLLSRPAPRYEGVAGMEWKIPAEQVERARKTIDREILNTSYFIVPANDGEAKRAGDILAAAGAPHYKVSSQPWGAELQREGGLPPPAWLKEKGIKRIVAFEMPGHVEKNYKEAGIDVVFIDHHHYKDFPGRTRPDSSFEQLASFIQWPVSRTDHALAVNDRSWIPGLKKMGLSEDEIHEIRKYDFMAQGRSPRMVDDEVAAARAAIPKLERDGSLYVLRDPGGLEAAIKQELAIASPDGLVSSVVFGDGKVGFSGDPAVADLLQNYDFTKLGYPAGSYKQYGGGDPKASKFFGFKPSVPPTGSRELVPASVEQRLMADVKSEMEKKAAAKPAVAAEVIPPAPPTLLVGPTERALAPELEAPLSELRRLHQDLTRHLPRNANAYDEQVAAALAFSAARDGRSPAELHGLYEAIRRDATRASNNEDKLHAVFLANAASASGKSSAEMRELERELFDGVSRRHGIDDHRVAAVLSYGAVTNGKSAAEIRPFYEDVRKVATRLLTPQDDIHAAYLTNAALAGRKTPEEIGAIANDLFLKLTAHARENDRRVAAILSYGAATSGKSADEIKPIYRNILKTMTHNRNGDDEINAALLTNAFLAREAERAEPAVGAELNALRDRRKATSAPAKDPSSLVSRGEREAAEPLNGFYRNAPEGERPAGPAAAEGLTIDPEVRRARMMPRGSAVITSAGNLEKKGIRNIIHAGTGAMTREGGPFEPSVQGVVDAVKNSLQLAKQYGHQRVAVPFLGGKVFVNRIGVPPQELVDQIVSSAVKNRGDLDLRFVPFEEEDAKLFRNALKKFAGDLSPSQASVVAGDITNADLHGATVIVNAGNMEMQFGGGLSGAIGRATGHPREIDEEAARAIENFYKNLPTNGGASLTPPAGSVEPRPFLSPGTQRAGFDPGFSARFPAYRPEPLGEGRTLASLDGGFGMHPKLDASSDWAEMRRRKQLHAEPDRHPWPASLDREIPADQIERARAQVNKDYLNETYFVIPDNDGEARRAGDVLAAAGAPHVRISDQGWGATLDREGGLPSPAQLKAKGIKRITAFEMPNPALEERYRNAGIDIDLIDHHAYPSLDVNRYQKESSLEQLAKRINWPMSRTDQAIAANDRSYINGMKEMGLSPAEISAVRRYDLVAQGNSPRMVDEGIELARKKIPTLRRDKNGVYEVPNAGALETYIKQELAIQSPDGLVDVFTHDGLKIGFSGNPKVAKALLDYDFAKLGYPRTPHGKPTWAQYGGGDEGASMFFGFKPKAPIRGELRPIPDRVLQEIRKVMDEARNGVSPVAKELPHSAEPLTPVFGKAPSLPAEKINYKVFGAENAEPLVMVHGLDSAWQTFENVIPELAKKYKVIVFDQRGHGLTPALGHNYSPETMARDMKGLLDHLGVERASFLGHSMGARTVTAFADAHPERVKGLVLEDMELFARADADLDHARQYLKEAERRDHFIPRQDFPNREALVRAMRQLYEPEEAEDLITRRAVKNPDGSYRLGFRPSVSVLYGLQGNVANLSPALERFPGKVLMLQADRGAALTDRGVRDAVAHGGDKVEHVKIKGSGHTMHRTNPQEFVDAVEGYLAKHVDAAPVAKAAGREIAQAASPSAAEGLTLDPAVRKAGMMPKGSAVITSSGDLEKQGIRNIIHAASGSADRGGPLFEPSVQGVTDSVKNSLALAKQYGHKRVAVPFIGGKIFVDRIGIPAQDLANQIVASAVKNRGDLEIRFVTFGEEDTQLFRNALKKEAPDLSPDSVQVLAGSITDGKLHGATAIVNAANMEVQFGGGLSGVIARATGQAREIDEEAQRAIRDYYQSH